MDTSVQMDNISVAQPWDYGNASLWAGAVGVLPFMSWAEAEMNGLDSACWLAAERYSLDAKAKRVNRQIEIITERTSERDIAKPWIMVLALWQNGRKR